MLNNNPLIYLVFYHILNTNTQTQLWKAVDLPDPIDYTSDKSWA